MNQAHSLMIKTNHHLIKGGELTDAHKLTITNRLLSAKTTPEQARRRFNKLPGNERDMYPYQYVLPYNNGEKLVTIFNQMPKTQILSMNNYELEILRLLHLFAPQNPEVADMVAQTAVRLKKTCFGNKGCSTGECFDAGLVTLRYISATAPKSEGWIYNLLSMYNFAAPKRKNSGYHGRNYTRYYIWYYWLCLSEMPFQIAERQIKLHKDEMLSYLNGGIKTKTDEDRILVPIKTAVIKNCLSKLPEYASL